MKEWFCLTCASVRMTEDNFIIAVCSACQTAMVEKKEVEVNVRRE